MRTYNREYKSFDCRTNFIVTGCGGAVHLVNGRREHMTLQGIRRISAGIVQDSAINSGRVHSRLFCLNVFWLKRDHFLKIVQMLNHLLGGQLVLLIAFPLSSINGPDDQVVVANHLRIE